jgi:purine-binding chemotaxis protein CheW
MRDMPFLLHITYYVSSHTFEMADIGIIKFQLGGMNFCMYSDRIVEIVRYTGVRKIPRPLPYVVGLIELRKHIVVVVDFRKRVGLSPITLSKDTVMIVVNLSSGMVGILVETISDFRRVTEKLILPPIAIAGFPEHLLHGVLTEKDDIMLIPNLDQIFASYINIRLVPISPPERIAFQYRFTHGALTRTLEGILLSQPALDPEIVRKLPHSLCLPSTLVHRMISYYPDFQSRQVSGKNMKPRWI